jgi:hypothetical protein
VFGGKRDHPFVLGIIAYANQILVGYFFSLTTPYRVKVGHEVTFAPGNTAAMAKSYFYSRETSSPLKRTTSGVTSITSSIPYGIHCE